MTQKVNPSINRALEAFKTAGAIAYGGSIEGYVVDSNATTQIAIQDNEINDNVLNEFDESHESDSLDVTIDPGEAFVFGSWVCIDTETTVTLEPDTTGQTVFVGWEVNEADEVIVGLGEDFTFVQGGATADLGIPLWEFDTDANGVVDVRDVRVDYRFEADSIEQGPGSGLDADTVDGVEASTLGGSDILDDGTLSLTAAQEIDFTDNLSVSNEGSGRTSVSVDDVFVERAGDTMTGDLDMDNNVIKNLNPPGDDLDAATKGYADSIAQGLDIKQAVRVCTCNQGNIDLTSTTDPNPIDNVTLVDGDRILLIEQTDATENGIYVATNAANPSTWVRAPDADEDIEVNSGLFTLTVEGQVSGNVGFILTTPDPITLGTTDLDFTRFSGAGQISAGRGLTRSGDVIDVDDIFVETGGDTMSGALSFDDDTRIRFGQDNDFSIRYVASTNRLQIVDDTNGIVAMTFDRTGDIDIPSGDIIMSGTDTITNVPEPTNDTDVATKAFVDETAQNIDAFRLGGLSPAEIAGPAYDGHRVALQNRFGAEGSTTTSSGFTTIAGSDLSFDPEHYQDDLDQLAIRLHYHVKGDITIRMIRQNAGTVVSGTEESGVFGSSFGLLDTGWVPFTDIGFESYQIQMRSDDGNDVSYNSVILDFGHPR